MLDIVAAAADPAIRDRYFEKVRRIEGGCWLWTGAISGRGHGRFWISDGLVVIAHRFALAIAHPGAELPPVVAHGDCDNPLCQNPAHLSASTSGENRREWAARRHRLGSALRDVRGARGRARELRDAAREGADIDGVMADGVRPIDRDQLPLW